MAELAQGDNFLDFDLPDADGARVSRAGLAGQPFVLFVYPKADTSGCTQEAGDFTRLRSDFDALGVRVVGLSPDPAKALAKFRNKHGLAVELASDEDKDLLQRLGLWIEKSMYGRKYMGAERSTFLVDAEGRLLRAWRKVSVPGHAEEVLAVARDLTQA